MKGLFTFYNPMLKSQAEATTSPAAPKSIKWPKAIWILLGAQLVLSIALLVCLGWYAFENAKSFEKQNMFWIAVAAAFFSLTSAIFSLSASNLSMLEVVIPDSISFVFWIITTAAMMCLHFKYLQSSTPTHDMYITFFKRPYILFAVASAILSSIIGVKLVVAGCLQRSEVLNTRRIEQRLAEMKEKLGSDEV
ncbi:hypothetical protein EDC01DRAFT_653508 [Geopyxis carbonaria]|nr:hypothetical protein EDC01DRAFT_653508 [Geopyxis carbonaria]